MFVVFDLDGTLADLTHRVHLVQKGRKQDWDLFYDLCHEDRPIYELIDVCQALSGCGCHIEIWSGRMERCRAKTEAWLLAYSVPYERLVMRPDDDERPDVELKEGWLRTSSMRPSLVFDDRKRLAEMWRRNGIRCCHVADGDY